MSPRTHRAVSAASTVAAELLVAAVFAANGFRNDGTRRRP